MFIPVLYFVFPGTSSGVFCYFSPVIAGILFPFLPSLRAFCYFFSRHCEYFHFIPVIASIRRMRGNLWNCGTMSVQLRHPEFISGSPEFVDASIKFSMTCVWGTSF